MLPSMLRYSLTADDLALVTMTGDDGRPFHGRVTIGELRRFAWAALADLEPDGGGVAPTWEDETAIRRVQQALCVERKAALFALVLLASAGVVVTRERFQEFTDPNGSPKTIDVHIHRLRSALAKKGIAVEIKSAWRTGYFIEHAAGALLAEALGL